MILSVFNWLSNALHSAPYIALIASFVWGVLSIVLSPCHLASIPLIVGFIDKQGRMTTRRAFMLAVLFSLGILITIALIGLVTGMLGRILGDVGRLGNYFVAVIFFIVGFCLLDILQLSFMGGVRARSHIWNRTRPLHLRIHGSHARNCFQCRCDKISFRRYADRDVCPRSLFRYYSGWHIYRSCTTVSELE